MTAPVRSLRFELLAFAGLFLAFFAGIVAFDFTMRWAESQPLHSFGWNWGFWAAIAVLLLANVAMALSFGRFRNAVRLVWNGRVRTPQPTR